jgi:hypothetical protein
MSEKLRSGVLTSFSGGELTPQLAGRVDKEEMKIGSRYVSNFIPEHQGGLKKFYGSGHVETLTDDLSSGYKMIPFDGCGEPLCLLFVPGKVYCVTRTDAYQVSVSVSLQMIIGASYVQSGDVLYITNENMGMAVITYAGKNDETGHHIFNSSNQTFVNVPFFPASWQGNYNGLPLHTSASEGAIIITGQQLPTIYSIELPDVLKGAGTGKSVTSETDSSLGVTSKYLGNSTGATVGTFTIELHRVRDGEDELVQKAIIGSETQASSSA